MRKYISEWKFRFFFERNIDHFLLKLEVNVSSEFIFNEK